MLEDGLVFWEGISQFFRTLHVPLDDYFHQIDIMMNAIHLNHLWAGPSRRRPTEEQERQLADLTNAFGINTGDQYPQRNLTQPSAPNPWHLEQRLNQEEIARIEASAAGFPRLQFLERLSRQLEDRLACLKVLIYCSHLPHNTVLPDMATLGS
jgi:hypothetical protein